MKEDAPQDPHPSAEEPTASAAQDKPAPSASEVPPSGAVAEELDELKAQLEEKSREIQELMDKYLRAYAELENFKKRTARDQAEWMKYANEALLRELLTVMDNLLRAQAHAPSAPDLSQWVTGVVLTVKQFEEILAKFGVTAIQAVGLPFDPAVHQAMLEVESDKAEGTVVEEFQKGYRLHDRVLRPALVAVAKKKSEVKTEKSEEGE